MSVLARDPRDLVWRIVVTVLLLLILAGPGAKVLQRLTIPSASSVILVVPTL